MVPDFSDLNRHRWVFKLADYLIAVIGMALVAMGSVIFVLGIDRLLMFWR